MKKSWWKILSVVCLLYAFVAGMLMPVPARPIVNESIRNLYYHVPMWFGMMILMSVSVVYSILYLRHSKLSYDIKGSRFASTGMLFGVLGIVTGAIWANYTWGQPWSNDIKQILAAIALLIYAAYFILRSSIDDIDKRARVSAVYNIFAYTMLFPTLFIIPRMYESLHPGGEGNPAINQNDIDPMMRIIFWPAVLGWTLLGVWISQLYIRIQLIKDRNILNG
ncbi:cytochrome c biogenesis protein CcsA [Phnomibacter ginsenosidimutans]|jgi:heme exporter protein C|uniref:ABC transporter permease n=1 Tax=Phnomibacter ginsenosidimutans TaxID=2676868 RepID=A0A6I6GU22_9BACT|nr:cytochrome c biogenesis protein CcsA [Phnomibacter ginsenosidimutans]QGW28589.1 ABC transporter permease [Phnomibacter ginsenosidimutans]